VTKNPVVTVWLRLLCVLLVFYMFWVTMGWEFSRHSTSPLVLVCALGNGLWEQGRSNAPLVLRAVWSIHRIDLHRDHWNYWYGAHCDVACNWVKR
jgi:hypothetical protein